MGAGRARLRNWRVARSVVRRDLPAPPLRPAIGRLTLSVRDRMLAETRSVDSDVLGGAGDEAGAERDVDRRGE